MSVLALLVALQIGTLSWFGFYRTEQSAAAERTEERLALIEERLAAIETAVADDETWQVDLAEIVRLVGLFAN